MTKQQTKIKVRTLPFEIYSFKIYIRSFSSNTNTATQHIATRWARAFGHLVAKLVALKCCDRLNWPGL